MGSQIPSPLQPAALTRSTNCFSFSVGVPLKEGNFLGKLIATNQASNTATYELKLPTDAMFSKVHGDIKLYYIVYEKEKIVMLDKFEPMSILSEGHASELVTYKGVMVSKQHAEKDMFKINLLNMIGK